MFSFFKRRKVDPKKSLVEALGERQLPTFPAVVMRALELLRDPNSRDRQVAQVLATDPGLTVRILKVVNSAAFGLSRPITSVQQAIVLLGRGPLESLLLTVAVRGALPTPSAGGFESAGFWRTAAFRAVAARTLSKMLHPALATMSFTASLLQDMAKPMLLDARGDSYGPLYEHWWHTGESLTPLEQAEFGWDHAEVATWLCQEWAFPETLAAAIGDHHGTGGDGESAPAAVLLTSGLRGMDDGDGLDALIDRAEHDFALPCDDVVMAMEYSAQAAQEVAAMFR